ncbi:ATP-binding response regulator [Anaeromyxobacter diazotrophicus]|uniref:histidine kinase n=1 Tax=Anaeromyxobacter diazotrophicus TaxID=2590199 RepID=A0A7I9VL09_9BACT|nr:hybrid sensor histidine kinase/response regulator [Anaeromyxobacter diazotrophicus]GEJ57092.1 hypothetical protein AMYX_18330 [Anaeromyxobacter diazotrophicus]
MNEEASSERLLVLAPTGRDAELALEVLRGAGLEGEACRGMAPLCEALEAGAGAALLAEEVLSPAQAALLTAWVARQPPWSDLPVLIFTSQGGPLDLRGPALARLGTLGNVTLLDRPLRRMMLVSAARAALRARRRQYAARDVLAAQRRSMTARDQFLAMLGHELRNPLGAITLAAQVMERKGGADARQLGVVQRQAAQLGRLVDDLLDVARVTSGKITLERRPLDLGELVTRSLEALEPVAAARPVAFAFRPPGEPLAVEGDPARLEQVVANLVRNAIKYTAPGGHVEVALARDGSDAVLVVRDDGIGIAPDHLAHVFDLFMQVPTTLDRSQGGLGLGLTVTRTLVAMHGGAITVESAGVGRGSTFTARLPLLPAGQEAPAAGAQRAPPLRRRRVLVVDDGEDNRAVMQMCLEGLGQEVRVASDGPSAVAQALAEPFEVILVDIGLPQLDGYEVARRIRSALGRAPFLVAATGYGQPEDRQRSLDAGFDFHLTKPIGLRAVEDVLRRADGRR